MPAPNTAHAEAVEHLTAANFAATLRAEAGRRVDDRYVHHALIRGQMRTMADRIERWERGEFVVASGDDLRDRVTALIDSWPTGDNGQDYRRAVTQCAAAVRAVLDAPPATVVSRPEAPDAWRDHNGILYLNLRKYPNGLNGAYDPDPSATPVFFAVNGDTSCST